MPEETSSIVAGSGTGDGGGLWWQGLFVPAGTSPGAQLLDGMGGGKTGGRPPPGNGAEFELCNPGGRAGPKPANSRPDPRELKSPGNGICPAVPSNGCSNFAA